MKKITLIFLVVILLFSLFSVTAFANTSESLQNVSANNSGDFSKIELAIAICVMFIVISIIGVMFMKTVIKNNNRKTPKK